MNTFIKSAILIANVWLMLIVNSNQGQIIIIMINIIEKCCSCRAYWTLGPFITLPHFLWPHGIIVYDFIFRFNSNIIIWPVSVQRAVMNNMYNEKNNQQDKRVETLQRDLYFILRASNMKNVDDSCVTTLFFHTWTNIDLSYNLKAYYESSYKNSLNIFR